jgi:flagellar basal body-associated protein FliL
MAKRKKKNKGTSWFGIITIAVILLLAGMGARSLYLDNQIEADKVVSKMDRAYRVLSE